MNYDHEKQKALNEKHLKQPEAGDYWNEMCTPCFLVLKATKYYVTFCEDIKAVDEDHWTWDLSEIKETTIDEFSKRIHYGSIPGCWCHVIPANTPGSRMKAFVAAYEELAVRGRELYIYT